MPKRTHHFITRDIDKQNIFYTSLFHFGIHIKVGTDLFIYLLKGPNTTIQGKTQLTNSAAEQ